MEHTPCHKRLYISVFICQHENPLSLFLHPFSFSLSLSHFSLSSKKMKASSISHVHTCKYPLRKQIIVIIRRKIEDKLMREQRER